MMNPEDQISATLSRRDWQIIMGALGELPGKVMYETAKKVEALLAENKDAAP